MSELTIPERVAAGAAWLDENRPGWLEAIDLAELDVSSCQKCMLGQLYGRYGKAPESAIYDENGQFGDEPACEKGFEAYGAEYAELTAEWRRLIESRRGAVSDAS